MRKILAADARRPLLRALRIILERAGYTVITALDGPEALRRVAVEHPDLLILDGMLPVLNGVEIVNALHANPNTRALPVLLLTACTHDQQMYRQYVPMLTAYLTQPFQPAELLTAVQQLLCENTGDDTEDNVYIL